MSWRQGNGEWQGDTLSGAPTNYPRTELNRDDDPVKILERAIPLPYKGGDVMRQYVEARFPTRIGPSQAHTETGEPYVVLVVGGIKPEGAPYPAEGSATPEEAVALWCEEFDKFANGRKGTIVWRTLPTITEADEDGLVQARARLALVPLENPSGIHPTEFRVLVLPDKVEEKTKGGIIIPDEKKDRDQYAVMEATIIECSPLAFTYESNWPEGAEKPKAGDRVVIAKYSGSPLKGKDGEDYKLIADKDVMAVLE